MKVESDPAFSKIVVLASRKCTRVEMVYPPPPETVGVTVRPFDHVGENSFNGVIANACHPASSGMRIHLLGRVSHHNGWQPFSQFTFRSVRLSSYEEKSS